MPENTRSTNHTYNEGMYSGVPGSGRSQTENTRSSELDEILAEHWSDLRVVESGSPGTRSNAHRKAKRRLEALIAAKVEEARKEWQKRSENSPYTKSWIAKQLGISRPYLNKLLQDPEQFTIGMVKKLAALQSREQDKV